LGNGIVGNAEACVQRPIKSGNRFVLVQRHPLGRFVLRLPLLIRIDGQHPRCVIHRGIQRGVIAQLGQ